MAVFRVEKTRDYTVMSNHHLRDKSLTLKAKGLLSQMLSLPEDWDYTLSGLSSINRESKDAIRTAINELERAGYIERRQTTDEHGKFSVNEYVIHECPASSQPLWDNPTTDRVSLPSADDIAKTEENSQWENSGEMLSEIPATEDFSAPPSSCYPSSENPMAGNPLPGNPTQLNTYKQNNEQQNTDLQNTHSFPPSGFRRAGIVTVEGWTEVSRKRAEIQEQIDYDAIASGVNRAQIDEFVEIMLEVALARSPTIKIGRDAEYPTALVQQRFDRIDASHIEKVLDGIRENTTRVRNTRAYLLAALFNAPSTTDNHYTMLVNHDMAL